MIEKVNLFCTADTGKGLVTCEADIEVTQTTAAGFVFSVLSVDSLTLPLSDEFFIQIQPKAKLLNGVAALPVSYGSDAGLFEVTTRSLDTRLAVAAWLAPPPSGVSATLWLRPPLQIGLTLQRDDPVVGSYDDSDELLESVNAMVNFTSIDDALRGSGRPIPRLTSWLDKQYTRFIERDRDA